MASLSINGYGGNLDPDCFNWLVPLRPIIKSAKLGHAEQVDIKLDGYEPTDILAEYSKNHGIFDVKYGNSLMAKIALANPKYVQFKYSGECDEDFAESIQDILYTKLPELSHDYVIEHGITISNNRFPAYRKTFSEKTFVRKLFIAHNVIIRDVQLDMKTMSMKLVKVPLDELVSTFCQYWDTLRATEYNMLNKLSEQYSHIL